MHRARPTSHVLTSAILLDAYVAGRARLRELLNGDNSVHLCQEFLHLVRIQTDAVILLHLQNLFVQTSFGTGDLRMPDLLAASTERPVAMIALNKRRMIARGALRRKANNRSMTPRTPDHVDGLLQKTLLVLHQQ